MLAASWFSVGSPYRLCSAELCSADRRPDPRIEVEATATGSTSPSASCPPPPRGPCSPGVSYGSGRAERAERGGEAAAKTKEKTAPSEAPRASKWPPGKWHTLCPFGGLAYAASTVPASPAVAPVSPALGGEMPGPSLPTSFPRRDWLRLLEGRQRRSQVWSLRLPLDGGRGTCLYGPKAAPSKPSRQQATALLSPATGCCGC